MHVQACFAIRDKSAFQSTNLHRKPEVRHREDRCQERQKMWFLRCPAVPNLPPRPRDVQTLQVLDLSQLLSAKYLPARQSPGWLLSSQRCRVYSFGAFLKTRGSKLFRVINLTTFCSTFNTTCRCFGCFLRFYYAFKAKALALHSR